MQVDGEPEQQPKKKKKVKKIDVPFVWGSTSLDTSVLEKLKEQEAEMHAADKLVLDTEVSPRASSPRMASHQYTLTGPQKCPRRVRL